MRKTLKWSFCVAVVIFIGGEASCDDDSGESSISTIRELDAYWAEVSRSVQAGDFEGYKATCHPEGVLVSGIKKSSYPLSQALAKWKPGFDDTHAKRMAATVEFRFSQRLHDSGTAHETGIFRYTTTKGGKRTVDYIHFEGLLRKSDTGWRIVMEYQKSTATEAEWNALASKATASAAEKSF